MKDRTPTDADIRIRRAVRVALADPRPNPSAAAWAILGGAPHDEIQAAWNKIAKKLGLHPPQAPEDPEERDLKRRLRDAARVPSKVSAKGRARRHWLDERDVRERLEQAMLDHAANLRALDGYGAAVADAVRKWALASGELAQNARRGRGQPKRLNDAVVHGLYTQRLEANRQDRPKLLERPRPIDEDEYSTLVDRRVILKRPTGKSVDVRSLKWSALEAFSWTQEFLGELPADTLKGIIKRERKRLKSLQS